MKLPTYPGMSLTVTPLWTVISLLLSTFSMVSFRKSGTATPSSLWRKLRAYPPSSFSLSTRWTGYPWAAMSRAAVIPVIPPPMTAAALVTGISAPTRGSSRHALAMAILRRSLALLVAASCSCMWIQEHWSRMLAMLNRYLFRPPFLQASLKRGSWVLGVQDATTTLLRSCSWIAAEMASRQSWAHAYWDSSARTTLGRVLA